MKVFYYCNFPAPYYVSFLDELGKLCDLTVVFERASSSERDDSWKTFSIRNATVHIMHGIHTTADMAFCPQIIKYVKKHKYDEVIVHDPASPTGMWFIWYLKLFKIPYCIQSEGGIPGDGKTGLKEKYKSILLRGAKLYISGMSRKDKEYFIPYGINPDQIVWYPFTSLYKKDILTKTVNIDEKLSLREELGIGYDKVIISVGSIIYRKAFDVLIKSIVGVKGNVGLYIVGGKPTEELTDIIETNGLTNIHFVEFIPYEKLAQYYQAADFYAMATREDTWGLFVNEAMANGLPVITTERCVAGVDLIEDGQNGYIVPVDDPDMMREKIQLLIDDDKLCEQMASNNIKKIEPFSFENEALVTYEELRKYERNE